MIQDMVLDELSLRIIEGAVKPGDAVTVDGADGVIEIAAGAPKKRTKAKKERD